MYNWDKVFKNTKNMIQIDFTSPVAFGLHKVARSGSIKKLVTRKVLRIQKGLRDHSLMMSDDF